MTVTLMLRAVTIEAYSRPMTPAPTTMRSRGRFLPARSWSESKIRSPSSGTFGLCAGRVPQAIRMCSPFRATGPSAVSDLDGVRIGEPRLPVNGRDAVARELRAHDLHLPGHDLLDAEGEIGDGDLAVDRVVLAVEALLAEAREVHDRFAERLGRDRSRVEADAADHFLAVDDGGLLPELRGGDRGLLSRRAGTDDDEVVGGRVQGRKLLTRRVKEAWSRPEA